jgi:polyisoprenoid-binding protein YceI
MRRLLLAAPLLIAAPLLAQAPMTAPGHPDPALVTGGHYFADPDHTLVEWQVDHLGFTPYFGLFGSITGTLDLDPRRPDAARVEVVIPVSKILTASAGLNAHLLRAPEAGAARPDFFGPTPSDARFVSTRVIARGRTAMIVGQLTLNGITRPITLQASFHGAGKAPAQAGGQEYVGFEATTSLRRSDFGLGTGVPLVGDEVQLKIAAGFEKTAAKASACGLDQALRFVGRAATPAVRSAVSAAVGAHAIRWIAPGDVVTQDLRADRLNVMLSGRNVITGARCG